MTDSPSSDDGRRPPRDPPTEETDPGSPTSPLLFATRLWRDGVLGAVGVLAFSVGFNGWWFFVDNGFDNFEYTVLDLFGDLAYFLVGTVLVFVAVGSALRRLRSD
jgi:hypothetical protein